ncbi:hypothetical protein NUKP104_11690 [Klebsiella variicola]|nr:hypothetical protein TUM16656_04000 [Klebsiella pneumoniae]GKJ23134.1 hypothetical protein NUKP24_07570 [Klebsiella variicola]GJK22515.1 hypothetical protein TUM17555_01900 [Klebsiella pneumoniae]GJK79490.1 hypothetical protein TUM17566_15420 [Klebsiella pneumoniae]GJL23332.1 hypothetical protein TUM17574_17080 [Klebsiella pneumoniae]
MRRWRFTGAATIAGRPSLPPERGRGDRGNFPFIVRMGVSPAVYTGAVTIAGRFPLPQGEG